VNHAQLQVLLARAQYDLAAALSASLIVLGDRLGLYRMLATARLTAQELADSSGLDFHYIESWLLNQAAGGYVGFDVASATYTLTPEQKKALVDETSEFFLPASFAFSTSLATMTDALEREIRDGKGVAAGRYPAATFDAIGRMAKSKSASIIGSFSDAIRSVLDGGADVVEIGCGEGNTLLMLSAIFPKIRARGVDLHAASIGRAKNAARAANLEQRIAFEVRDAKDLPESAFDVALIIETLHEIADPERALRAIHRSLRKGGRLAIVEPLAGETVVDNLNPSGRLLSATNLLFCLPTSIASGRAGLGALAGESRLREVVESGGFSRIIGREIGMFVVLEAVA
jgi:SAM-dependent methyltransferase